MGLPKKNLKRIGVLGGTFDPPHLGHLGISKFAIKKLNLQFLIWAVTKKNPLKNKSYFSLQKRINFSRKLASKVNKIKIETLMIKNCDHHIPMEASSAALNFIKKKLIS